MSSSRRSALINVMIEAAEKAGRGLARDFGEVENLQVSKKGPNDFVSAADIRAEETIKYNLSKARPTFGFLMEESGEEKGKDPERRFIVDPLDGTKNFLHGIPHWAVSIAAEEKGKIVAGVVHNPITDDLFWAERGTGAFWGNKRIECTKTNALSEAFIISGSARRSGFEAFEAAYKATSGVRRLGAAALDICIVASGRAEAFWERNLKPWDVAAAKLILQEARGRFTDIKMNQDNIYAKDFIATNGAIHDDFRKLIRQASPASSEEKAAS